MGGGRVFPHQRAILIDQPIFLRHLRMVGRHLVHTSHIKPDFKRTRRCNLPAARYRESLVTNATQLDALLCVFQAVLCVCVLHYTLI